MTVTAYDFLRLRTGWSYFNVAKAEQRAQVVFDSMSDMMEMNDSQLERPTANDPTVI